MDELAAARIQPLLLPLPADVSAYIAAFKQPFGCTPGAMLTGQVGT